jgi:thiamine pyrophosphate-dependent acetolactate synthase large subunit-like protein
VLNNRSLGWPKWIQRASGERYLASDFEATFDFVAVAKASGVHAERISEAREVESALDRARKASEDGVPALLDCMIDPWDFPRGFIDFHRDVWGLEIPPSPGSPP